MAKMQMNFELFDSFSELNHALEIRPDQPLMNGKRESQTTGQADWYGSASYEEAVEIMRNGYPKAIDKIKKQESKLIKVRGVQVKNKQKNDIVGHTPIVPNLLQGIPIDMIHTERQPQKVKTVHIAWNMCDNCGTTREEIENNSLIVLEAITKMEQSGIRVRLDTTLMCARGDSQYIGASVAVKGYREKLDITRVSGLMASTSLFRRIGFRWMETCPVMTDMNFRYAYGQSVHDPNNEFIQYVENDIFTNGVFITMRTVRDNPTADKLIEYIEQKLAEKVKRKVR